MTTKLKFSVLLLLSFLVSKISMAQSPDISGYYINLNNDTIKGKFPDYKDWTNNPEKVKFTPVNTTDAVILTASITTIHLQVEKPSCL